MGNSAQRKAAASITRVKRVARHLVDRVAKPYVEQSVREVVASIESSKEPSVGPPTLELHAALHEARSLALADMPRDAPTILSAGASGSWYFDWFDQEYGPVTRHIGVEAYLPRPDHLPPNVEWVEADLAAAEGVASVATGSVDLVFSGQNLEHLWPDQMIAFLIESNRALRDGGFLVVDSPNRELTEAYQWSMGEHTVELTPSEAEEVLTLAGFTVEHMKGVWLCRDGNTLLPLDPSGPLTGPGGFAHRIAQATSRPSDSFIWWAEARKIAAPDREGLRSAVARIFELAWNERVGRMAARDGEEVTLPDGRAGVVMRKGQPGYAMLGPHMAVPPGTYEFRIDVRWSGYQDTGSPIAQLDIVALDELMGTAELKSGSSEGQASLACTVTLPDLRFAVHARLFCTGAAEVTAPLTLAMSPDPWRSLAPWSGGSNEP